MIVDKQEDKNKDSVCWLLIKIAITIFFLMYCIHTVIL